MVTAWIRNGPLVAYYVDATGGNDDNPGTKAEPWQTIAKVNASTFAPGNHVLFKRGETWTGTRLTVPSSGTAGAPIVFGAYGTGARPVFVGDSDVCIIMTNKSHISLIGLATNNASGYFGLNIETSTVTVNNILVQDCDFGAASLASVFLTGTTTYPVQNVTFSNCDAHDSSEQGFHLYQTTGIGFNNITFIDCNAYNNGTTANQHHGWYISYADAVQTIRCKAYNNVGHGFQWQNGITNALMDSCESYDNDSQGVWINGATSGNNFINNLIHDNADSGFEIGTTVTQSNIYHNTIVNNGSGASGSRQGITLYSGTTGVVIKNNLVKQDSAVIGDYRCCIKVTTATELQTNTFDRNLYQYDTGYGGQAFNVAGTEKTLAQWQAYTGNPDPNSINADPVFVTEYTNLHIQTISPAKNAGETGLGVTDDYEGTTRDAQPDIGALEYVA